MKKYTLLMVIYISVLSLVHGQNDLNFGITGGYTHGSSRIKAAGTLIEEISNSASGFYVGLVGAFPRVGNFQVQPELYYSKIKKSDQITLPILLKYYLIDEIHLQAGPQIGYSLDKIFDDFNDIGRLHFGISGGIGFDITEKLFIEARYLFQLNNTYTGEEDLTAKLNYITVGVGIRFF